MSTPADRRRRRSGDPLVALHYQLASARNAATVDTLVVADDAGVVVAGAGSWAACEELAAYAPLLLEAARSEEPARLKQLRSEVSLERFHLGGASVLVCARDASTAKRAEAAKRAAVGARRILAAA